MCTYTFPNFPKGFNSFLLIAGSGGFFMATVLWMRKIRYAMVGQEISDSYAEIQRAMENLFLDHDIAMMGQEIRDGNHMYFVIKHNCYLSSIYRKKFAILMDQLSSPSAPLRPLDIFDLKISSLLSLYSLIFTYLIVLAQFEVTV